MKNRIVTICVRLVFVVLALTFTAKADSLTWDFSFYSYNMTTLVPNGVVSAAGTIVTEATIAGLTEPYYPFESLTGTMNGDAMIGVPCFHCGIDAGGILFDFSPLEFSVDGLDYTISDDDNIGVLFLEPDSSPNPYGLQAIRFTLTEDPVSAPEASGIVLLLVGLVSVGLYWKRSQLKLLGANSDI